MATIRESTIEQLLIVSPRLDPIRQIVAARKFDCAVLVGRAYSSFGDSRRAVDAGRDAELADCGPSCDRGQTRGPGRIPVPLVFLHQ
jgi:hypothetical protein